MRRTLTFWVGVLGVLFFVVPAILGGFQFESYNHISQFLSESYATGTPYGNQLRFFGYLPSGIFLTLFALLAPQFLPKSKHIKIAFWLFAVFYGLGIIVVSLFPCDEGCNREFIDPTISQIIHNISGGLTYLFIPFVVIAIGMKARTWAHAKSFSTATIICGTIAFVFAWAMMSDPNGSYIGLFQRLVEGAVLFWILVTAFFIKRTQV